MVVAIAVTFVLMPVLISIIVSLLIQLGALAVFVVNDSDKVRNGKESRGKIGGTQWNPVYRSTLSLTNSTMQARSQKRKHINASIMRCTVVGPA
jgi:hypothetical protein